MLPSRFLDDLQRAASVEQFFDRASPVFGPRILSLPRSLDGASGLVVQGGAEKNGKALLHLAHWSDTDIMQNITPHLWFDKEAKEAAAFYVSLFPNSKTRNITTLHNTPSGDCDIVSFELSGQPFMAISAGPLFKFNPSVSFQFKCRTKDEVMRCGKSSPRLA